MGTRQLASYNAKLGQGITVPFELAGTPVTNVSFLGRAVVGSLLIDNSTGKLYVCSATNGSSTISWTVVGSQT
jgi:hypothetical protein